MVFLAWINFSSHQYLQYDDAEIFPAGDSGSPADSVLAVQKEPKRILPDLKEPAVDLQKETVIKKNPLFPIYLSASKKRLSRCMNGMISISRPA